MKLQFAGDRKSKIVALGMFLRKIFGKHFIRVIPWDGYKSWISVYK